MQRKTMNVFYPFGKRIVNLSFGGGTNQLKYNGKELQSQSLAGRSLDWYDYGARFYDPTLGRWHSLDNKAEKYFSWSSYTYALSKAIYHKDLRLLFR
jgi:RHS repeat-associated protein